MTAARSGLGSWVLLLAVVAAAIGVIAYVLRPTPAVVPVVDVEPLPSEAPLRAALANEWEGTRTGGTYGGRVVDGDGRPVAGADVLLVGVDKGAEVTVQGVQGVGTGADLSVPVFGEYRTAAAARTDKDGRFTMAAGDAQIVAIFAYERGYSPGLLSHSSAHPLVPGPDHEIRVLASGWLKGKVEDAVTHAPIAGADAAIQFQNVANRGTPGPVPFTATNAFARFAVYVGRELGPLVWGLAPPEGETAFHVRTAADGTFTFGPVMSEIQVEVVITHPDYMWTDADPDVVFPSDNTDPTKAPVGRKVRTIVPPGQTVERTYLLEKGKEISGRILDDDRKPLEGVTVSLEHVAQYAQHPWYRTHPRLAITDAKGRFHIGGLSYEPYNLQLTHPSIDTEFIHGVKAGSDADYPIQGAGGWLDLVVEGGPTDGKPLGIKLVLEPSDGRSARREESVTVREGKVTVERLRPGRYDVSIHTGTQVSETAAIEVVRGAGVGASVRLTAGGSVRIPVQDASGHGLDPATVELEAVRTEGSLRRAALVLVRQGEAQADGLLGGRYRARARAMGYVPGESDVFEVRPDQTTSVPPVVLRKQAYVQLTGVVGDDGKPVPGDVRLSWKQAGGEFEPVKALQAGLLPLRPGSVTIRAEAADGRRFEKSLELGDGETVSLEIRLAP